MIDIAKKLNCPVCQGYNLYDCPTELCEQLRQQISDRLARGETEQQIVQHFVDQYGEQALNAPPPTGFNLLGWTMPAVGFALGVVVFVVVLRSLVRRRATVATSAPVEPIEALPSDYVERLERELKKFRGVP
jgi:cytochrome c-type biogenesis protein CcmH